MYMLIEGSIIHQSATVKELQINLFREADIKRFIFHPASAEGFQNNKNSIFNNVCTKRVPIYVRYRSRR